MVLTVFSMPVNQSAISNWSIKNVLTYLIKKKDMMLLTKFNTGLFTFTLHICICKHSDAAKQY